jgi:hypothetical protein
MKRLTGYLTISTAAAVKRVAWNTVRAAMRAGALDTVRLDHRPLVVANERFQQWGVNRKRQRRIRQGLKRLRAGIPSLRRTRGTKRKATQS